eukprot:6269372-Prorocentrum_lima.AAC.1
MVSTALPVLSSTTPASRRTKSLFTAWLSIEKRTPYNSAAGMPSPRKRTPAGSFPSPKAAQSVEA